MSSGHAIVEDSHLIRKVGIPAALPQGALNDHPINYLFWVRLDQGSSTYYLYFMKPSSGLNPVSIILRKPPAASGGTGRHFMLTAQQWRVVEDVAHSAPMSWLP